MNTLDESLLFSGSEERLQAFYGKLVNVSAMLAIRGGECFLIPETGSIESIFRIEIYAPGLEKKLDLLIGGWVGGPAAYLDMVEVTGILREGTTRRNYVSISDIESLILHRDGQRFVVSM
jgi:hypothetical protein